MAAQENKLSDELLPEIEIGITPSKLSENVRVDLHRFSAGFIEFLVVNGHIPDSIHNDVQIITMNKIPKFCQTIRDAFRVYNIKQHANIQV